MMSPLQHGKSPPPSLDKAVFTKIDEPTDIKPSCSKPVVGKLQMLSHPVAVRPLTSTCHVCAAEGATLHYGGVVCGEKIKVQIVSISAMSESANVS
ncbi:hypothetical protein COOONC_23752 [Cooperia oncophora]